MDEEIKNNLKNLIMLAAYIDTIIESLARILKRLCHIKSCLKKSLDEAKDIAALETELKWHAKSLLGFKDNNLYEKAVLIKAGRAHITEEEVIEDKLRANNIMYEIREIIFDEILQKIIQKDFNNENEEDKKQIEKLKNKLLSELHIMRTKIFGLEQNIRIEKKKDYKI